MYKKNLDINNLSLRERIQICLALMSMSEVSELCSRFGYVRDKVDVDLIERACKEHGAKFANEFVDLYLNSLDTRQTKQKLEGFSGIVGYNDAAMTGATGLIGTLGNIGIGIASLFTDRTAETEANIYKDLYAQQQAIDAQNAAAKTKWYIIGGVTLGIVLIVVLVLVLRRNK